MSHQLFPHGKPPIIVSDLECRRLIGLAHVTRLTLPEVADELAAEMERAEVVAADMVPHYVVQMGSYVTFKTGEDGAVRSVTLVYPRDADIAAGRISILTPIGAALIGMAVGYSIDFTSNDGRLQTLTVLEVKPPIEPQPQAA